MANQTKKLAEMRFQACPEQLQEVRRLVRAISEKKGCDADLIDGIVLAVDEASANVIKHGYEMKNAGDIILEIFYSRGELVFRLTDYAKPVDLKGLQSRKLDDIRPGGLGIHLIRAIMDEYGYLKSPRGVGNVLEMRKKIAEN
ncbi:MAG: ATP-binding protein [Gammaproteobacteria bacterium]|nr:ATP-binding protein [Gammaproteobacteria bacterium]